uniref:Dentin sialophosphoprotein-like n=1 Tax=Globodera pallida TaxID=36090 RepID=A0A183BPB2_GLOPA
MIPSNKDLFPFETKVALNVNTSAEQEESAAETELPYSENTTAGQLAFVRSDSAEEPEANHTVIESGSKKRAHAIEVFDVTSSEHSSADASAEDKTVGEPISFNTGSSSLAIDGTHASEESGSKPSEAIPEESGSKSLEANDGSPEESGSKSLEANDGSAKESGSKSPEADDGSAEEAGSKSPEADDGSSEESGSKSLEAIGDPLSSEEMDIGWEI